jgi:tetratricopeptide (TPR) repeat protein
MPTRCKTLLLNLAVCLLAAGLVPPVHADEADDGVVALQREWEVIRYQTPAGEREKRYEALADKARRLATAHPERADAQVWDGIVLSSLAGEKGGLGALGLVKEARARYEAALEIEPTVLAGSAYNSLGVLYYKVPGWPLGFGDKDKARALLQKALEINPDGIDPNFFYGEFLLETGDRAGALSHLQRALNAPARPGRQVADAGRREEVRALIEKARAGQ